MRARGLPPPERRPPSEAVYICTGRPFARKRAERTDRRWPRTLCLTRSPILHAHGLTPSTKRPPRWRCRSGRDGRVCRSNVWGDLPDYIQIWMEKEALAGVAWDVTEDMGVGLWVARGYSSISYLHNAAQHINNALQAGKTAYIYNLGDHDPSGCDAWEKAVNELRGFATAPDRVHFQRIAVTPEQIRRLDLPSRPTKKTDSRAKDFEGESVELDAIPPDALRGLIRDTIESHIPEHVRRKHEQVEARERETLRQLQDYL